MSNEKKKSRKVEKDEAVRIHTVTQDPIPRRYRQAPERKPKKEE